jgi:hypothetical protein
MLVDKPKKRFFLALMRLGFPLAPVSLTLSCVAHARLVARRFGLFGHHMIAPTRRNVTVMLATFELLSILHALIAGNVDVVLRN